VQNYDYYPDPEGLLVSKIRLRYCTVRFLDGFRATAKVAAGATPADTETTLGIDSFTPATPTTATTIPLGVRFTVSGVNQIYTVTAVTLNDTTGAVNDTPANLDTTLTVDGITGRIPAGTTFTIVGSSLTFTVVSTSETGSDTTEITFTPAIATASGVPVEDAVITFAARPVSITITPALATADTLPVAAADITILGRALSIKIGDGNVTWNETAQIEYQMDRGVLDAAVEGDDVPVDVSLDCVYEFLTAVTGSGVPTPEDVIEHRGEAAAWESTSADPCEPYCIDMEVDYAPPCSGINHEITPFPTLRVERMNHDVAGATISMSGKCNVTGITSVRRAY
jgi:hypothetical protein